MSQCPTCKREFADDTRPLTTVRLFVAARVAPGAVVLRTHIADIVQEAVLAWMHENTFDSIDPSDDEVDLLDIVIAR